MPTSTFSSEACIPFTGYVDKRTGYGAKRVNGKLFKAHRLAYIEAFGEVPAKMHIDHTCHNEALAKGECDGGACEHRRCTNINHLRVVTASENHLAGANGLANRTHCKNGHDLSVVGVVKLRKSNNCNQCYRTNLRNAKAAYKERQRSI
jgi:hypothetical protein